MPKDRTTHKRTTKDRRDPTFVCALYAPDRRRTHPQLQPTKGG